MNFRKNDRMTVAIDGMLHDGTGVGHRDGVAVFVPGTAPGDVAEVLIVKVEKRFLRGKLLSVQTPSTERVAPVCPLAGRCGGCATAHLSYAAELRWKEQRVRDSFARIGNLSVPLRPIEGSPSVERYRNKAQYPVAEAGGVLRAGFYAPHSHRVVPGEDCLLQPERAARIVEAVLRYAGECGVSAYDERTGAGLLRHIFVREGFATGEVCVMPIVNGAALPREERLVELVRAAEPGVVSILLNVNETRGNVILGRESRLLFGRPYLEDVLCGLRFRISPRSFYQINHAQCERLYARAAEYAGLTGNEVVCDLYCGVGTIGLTMARRAKRLIGVEVVPEAVEDARINAAQNGIGNAEFLCGTAETLAGELAARGFAPDVCIVDPPRAGCDAALIESLARLAPKRIVYVSCDPATLARDAALLAARGFAPEEASPFDMFPRAAHVECVLLLTREEA